MQDQRQQQEPGFFEENKRLVNNSIGISQILSLFLCYWLRRSGTIGDRFGGWQIALSFILFPVLVILFMGPQEPESYEIPFLSTFMFISLCLAASNAIRRRELAGQGARYHSRYSGVSLFYPWCGTDELQLKGVVEASVIMLGGASSCIFAPTFGVMLIVCAVAQAISIEYERLKHESIKREMRDAMEDQRYMQSMWEEVQDEQNIR